MSGVTGPRILIAGVTAAVVAAVVAAVFVLGSPAEQRSVAWTNVACATSRQSRIPFEPMQARIRTCRQTWQRSEENPVQAGHRPTLRRAHCTNTLRPVKRPIDCARYLQPRPPKAAPPTPNVKDGGTGRAGSVSSGSRKSAASDVQTGLKGQMK